MRKLVLLLSSSVFCAAQASSAFADVTGTVKLDGKAPAAEAINMDQDPKCKEMNAKGAKTDDVIVNGGNVQDVFVTVKAAPAGAAKVEGDKLPAVTLDQKGCMYNPKVFGIVAKQKLDIINSDPTLHNIHAMAKKGEFNVGMPKQGQHVAKEFKKAEGAVPIKCDVHPWMHATAWTMDHTFFGVTDSKGAFKIAGLPDGEYDLVATHSKLGEAAAHVKVAGGNGTADFTLKAK